ncbi:hypothetical protein SDC9_132666 [bioreactor metagenome]|uniref:Uncharacterized protein n=1 Tax=bioreactor metagenome TaxID=1076179 RepID=A0A645D8Q2_9ZZZZ
MKPDFRHIRPGFRKHFLQHGFFQRHQFFVFALAEGDERINQLRKCTDLCLFKDITRINQFCIKKVIGRNIEQPMVSCALCSPFGDFIIPSVCLVI